MDGTLHKNSLENKGDKVTIPSPMDKEAVGNPMNKGYKQAIHKIYN
jgi:hypothetical protein